MVNRFGEKLHSLREKKGMTLLELAAAVGLKAHGYISELESGKKAPTVNFVVAVSRIFHVSTDDLLIDDRDLPESPATSSKYHRANHER